MQTIGESPMASNMPAEAHVRVMHVTLEIAMTRPELIASLAKQIADVQPAICP